MDTFSKFMFNILKNYMEFMTIYHFYHEKIKIEKVGKLVNNLHDKNECVIHITNFKASIK